MRNTMTSRRPLSTRDGSDSGGEECDDMPCKDSNRHLYVHAPIDKLGVPGRWLRHKLLDGILVGAPVLTSIQRYRTPGRTTIMKMISFLGTEDFYTVLFLLICWSFDARLGRLFGVLMGIGFYAAGSLKSVLCLPRPEWPRIQPEEAAYDWALPSHHSLLGTILPWYLWIYINLHTELSSIQLACMFVVIALWSFSVMFSRLYLGVHSPADIVSGGFVGVLALSMWLQVDDMVDSFISQQRIENLLQCVLLLLVLLYLHPKCDPGNPSYTDNCCLAGVVTGLIAARNQRSRLLGFPSLMETLSPETTLVTVTYLSLARLLSGGTLIFSARAVLKFIVTNIIKIVFKIFGLQYYSGSEHRKANLTQFKHYSKDFHLPPIYPDKASDTEDDDQPSNTNGHECKHLYVASDGGPNLKSVKVTEATYNSSYWDVDVPSKCIVYSILTYFALEIVPQIFIVVGI